MKKSIIIFAVPEDLTEETQLKELGNAIKKIFGIASTLSLINENDLNLETSKPDYISYFEDLSKVIEMDSFNKIMSVQKFWENIKLKTPGFDKKHFTSFLNIYNSSEETRKYVAIHNGEILLRLIIQAVEML